MLRSRHALGLLLAAACLLQTDTAAGDARSPPSLEGAPQLNITALLRQAPGLRGHTQKGGPLDLFRWHARYAARMAGLSWAR